MPLSPYRPSLPMTPGMVAALCDADRRHPAAVALPVSLLVEAVAR